MEDTNELDNSQNVQETDSVEELDSVSDTQSDQDETSNDEVATLKQQNKELFARAKRAEGFVLENGQWVKKPKPAKAPTTVEQVETTPALSPKDYLSLTENKISSDDFDEVMRLSKILGKSVSETLKDKTAKVILATRQEERQSAQATATTSTRRTSRTDSDSEMLRNAERGIVPEGADDIARFAAARLAAKKAALKR